MTANIINDFRINGIERIAGEIDCNQYTSFINSGKLKLSGYSRMNKTFLFEFFDKIQDIQRSEFPELQSNEIIIEIYINDDKNHPQHEELKSCGGLLIARCDTNIYAIAPMSEEVPE